MRKEDVRPMEDRLAEISAEFVACGKAIAAIGDETRQLIVVALLESGCEGLRVGAVTERTHLSRPAVSHHLQVLREAGVINMRREGTRNYYYLDPKNGQWETLLSLMLHIHGAAEAAQGRHCDKGEEV